jgi:hydrogenase-4 component B
VVAILGVLVYMAFLRSCTSDGPGLWLVGALAAPVLALVGGLALACFVKVFGAVFLGAPRSEHATSARESGTAMLAPMAVLAACCVFIGLGPHLVAPVLDSVVRAWPAGPGVPPPLLADAAPLPVLSTVAAVLLLALVLGLALARRARPRPESAAVPTWDCGYAAPSARMQYTSSSFADLLVGMFAAVLGRVRHAPAVTGLFPARAELRSHVPELVLDRAVLPALRLGGRVFAWFRWLQHGASQLYILYVLAALVLLLVVWR